MIKSKEIKQSPPTGKLKLTYRQPNDVFYTNQD